MSNKCPKHDCFYDYREMGGGKSTHYCSECEKEQCKRLLDIFKPYSYNPFSDEVEDEKINY